MRILTAFRKMHIPIFILIFFISCNSIDRKKSNSSHTSLPCLIKFDSLFQEFDTTKVFINRTNTEGIIEVEDKPGFHGERGIFRFTEDGYLLFYSFVQDSSNNSSFYIEYDKNWRKHRVSYHGGDVLAWKFINPEPDSIIRVQFLLSELDCVYEKVNVRAGYFKQENLKLFKSQFVKVKGCNIEVPAAKLGSTRKLVVYGTPTDNCSKDKIDFKDTVTVL